MALLWFKVLYAEELVLILFCGAKVRKTVMKTQTQTYCYDSSSVVKITGKPLVGKLMNIDPQLDQFLN